MTDAHVLAACRSNPEYRGIDDASVREMLDELSAHLADAEASGGTGQDATGRDVRTFAAAWARARSPLPRRVPRTVCPGAFVLGCLLLLTCLTGLTCLAGLTRWTTESAVIPGNIAFWAVL
ncbi:hypothetical protein [Streptomyces virginiae]|uniref:hypothetical protein n=1 Tax=Streptomyces virginiae TaxID=1961 RepID=UPI003455B763